MRRILACCLLVLGLAAPPAFAGEWIAGDLHVHTTYSHDSYGGPSDDNTGPEDFYTFGQTVTEDFAIAAARGLDFLAITDHNDIRSQTDPGFGFGGVLGIPAYENSLHGHGQMLGARKLYDNGDSSPAAVRAMEESLHADGGLLQANHPTDPLWAYDYSDVPVDTVEAWNLPWFYQPPFPASGDHDAALRFWTADLDRGAHVGATGGSDSHWKSTVAGQGPGQPTTWVYAADRSVSGVLAGLRNAHTFVSAEPPAYGGPKLFLEGERNGGWSAMQGDTVPANTPLRVHAVGAPGATLRVLSDNQHEILATPVTSDDFTTPEFTAPANAVHAFAELCVDDRTADRPQVCPLIPVIDLDGQTTYCRNRIAMLALTSAIYLRPATLQPLR